MEKTLTESEKIEQLMRPRYLVIARWPSGCPYKKGDILIQCDDHLNKFVRPGDDEATTNVFQPDSYPANLKKLEWWEERTPEGMPKYVKNENGAIYKAAWTAGAITENGQQSMRMDIKESEWQVIKNVMCFFKPATEQEYPHPPFQ